jgi:prenyltransferase beta subunit
MLNPAQRRIDPHAERCHGIVAMAAHGPGTGCALGVASMLGHLIPYHFADNQRGIVPAHRMHLLEKVRRWLPERQTEVSKAGQHRPHSASPMAAILSWFR